MCCKPSLKTNKILFCDHRETILKGAKENKLPAGYIKFLKSISHNGYKGKYDIG